MENHFAYQYKIGGVAAICTITLIIILLFTPLLDYAISDALHDLRDKSIKSSAQENIIEIQSYYNTLDLAKNIFINFIYFTPLILFLISCVCIKKEFL